MQKLRLAAMLDENLHLRVQAGYAQDVLHSVKNLLQNTSGMLQLLGKIDGLNATQTEAINNVYSQLKEMVAVLADYGRKEKLQTKAAKCSINQLVQEVLHGQKARFMLHRVGLEMELAEGLPPIWLEAGMIKQVLLACLDNSLAAILAKRQRGGCVWVRTQLAAKDWVRILVDDNGTGLTPEQQAAFFTPYFTTKPNGSGIGTSLSRAIVRQHGGEMSVSGRLGEGCCVCIELPRQGGRHFDRAEFYEELAEQLLMK